ncbi:MAG: phenylalanine--tRNA ligase subunit alpha, partial [bacterium]
MKSDTIISELQKDVAKVENANDLVLLKSKYLGKKSFIGSEMSKLALLQGNERALLGKQLNILKASVTETLLDAEDSLNKREADRQYAPFDISRPGQSLGLYSRVGHLHPATLVLKETFQIFTELGFAIVDSPEIETDWYN